MVKYLLTIEDREKRNKMAKTVIFAMGQLSRQNRDTNEYNRKLWDHLSVISDFKLDVDSPYPRPDPSQYANIKPQKVSYQNNDIKFKHYGYNIQRIIQKVADYPEGKKKDLLTLLCANTLKKLYMTWNRETVSDEVISLHLESLSNGKLKLKDSDKLQSIQQKYSKLNKKKYVNGNSTKQNTSHVQSNYKNRTNKKK